MYLTNAQAALSFMIVCVFIIGAYYIGFMDAETRCNRDISRIKYYFRNFLTREVFDTKRVDKEVDKLNKFIKELER